MTPDTINRLMAKPIDWSAPSAALDLAWSRLASDAWSRRDFTPATHAAFAAALREAWKTVRMMREGSRRAKLANEDPDIHMLRVRRAQLFNKSFHMPIENDLRKIDDEIRRRTDALAVA